MHTKSPQQSHMNPITRLKWRVLCVYEFPWILVETPAATSFPFPLTRIECVRERARTARDLERCRLCPVAISANIMRVPASSTLLYTRGHGPSNRIIFVFLLSGAPLPAPVNNIRLCFLRSRSRVPSALQQINKHVTKVRLVSRIRRERSAENKGWVP